MRIIKPRVEFITPVNGEAILQRIEECGRVCYKSEDRITEDSALRFVYGILERGHEAVLEHCAFTRSSLSVTAACPMKLSGIG